MICAGCGTDNDETAEVCRECGNALEGAPGAAGEQSDDDYFAAAIGPRNTSYYLRQFEKISSGAGRATWNWAAFFNSFAWLLYRKMGVYAAVYFSIPLFIFLLFYASIVAAPAMARVSAIGAVALYVLVAGLVFPAYANAIYLRVVQKEISTIKRFAVDRASGLRVLASKTGTSRAAVVVAPLGLIPLAAALVAIYVSSSSYRIQAQVREGYELAAEARAAVSETIIKDSLVPADRRDAGLSPNPRDTSGRYVRSVEIVSGRVDVTFGNEADEAISGKKLSMTPYVDDRNIDWKVLWQCGYARVPAAATARMAQYSAGTIEKRYMPPACR